MIKNTKGKQLSRTFEKMKSSYTNYNKKVDMVDMVLSFEYLGLRGVKKDINPEYSKDFVCIFTISNP